MSGATAAASRERVPGGSHSVLQAAPNSAGDTQHVFVPSRAQPVGHVLLGVGLAIPLVAYAWAQVATGVDLVVVLRWLGIFVGTVMLPGFALVRAGRPRPAALLDDVAWSTPVGLVVTLLGWLAGQVLGREVHPAGGTAVALAVVLAIPCTRRRLFGRPAPGWGLGAGLVVVVSMLVTVLWTATMLLAAMPVVPSGAGFAYTPDSVFQVAMTGELTRGVSPSYPMVAGASSSYHWFFHAASAHLGQGLDTTTVVARLFPVCLLLALVLITASVARQIAGRSSAAAIAAVLVGVVGNTLTTAWVQPTGIAGRYDADGGALTLDPFRLYWQVSPTQTMSWVAGVACLGLAIEIFRATGHRWVPALGGLAVMSLVTAGSKSSVPPVIICGLAGAAAYGLVRREWSWVLRGAAAAAVSLATWVFAMLFIYPGGSYGLRLQPGGHAYWLVGRMMPDLATWDAQDRAVAASLPVALAAVAVAMLPLLPRLAGLWWLSRLRPQDPAGILCTGVVLAGLAGTFLTSHPGQSEVFFIVGAYPLGLAGSAAGFSDALAGWAAAGVRRAAVVMTATAVAAVVATTAVTDWAGLRSPLVVWRQTTPPPGGRRLGFGVPARDELLAWGGPVLLLTGLVAAITALVVLVARSPRTGPPQRVLGRLATVFAFALVACGLVPTWLAVTGANHQSPDERQHAWEKSAVSRKASLTTAALIEGAQRIHTAAHPDDVVATNRVCAQQWRVISKTRLCNPTDFTVAAYTGLRVDVSGWAYADPSLAQAWTTRGGYARMPFWDPARLRSEQELITAPSPALATQAWARGVRWILADQAAGPVSARLGDYGAVEYSGGGVTVVRLRAPQAQPTG